MFGKRILVLAPHPDDEVVACCAAIGRAQKEGAEIFVLFLTHGCVARETLWIWERRRYDFYVERRFAESETVTKLLNIKSLNHPVRPARHLWQDLERVYASIDQAITAHNIDQLWVPAFEGGNADHDAANAVSSLFAKSISVLEFAEYNFFNNKQHSHAFPYPNGTEQTITLTNGEQQKKSEALALYLSEQFNLSYVQVERETYRPLPTHDYSKPAHPGTLWYARFQWVPIPHPGVDRTNPRQVSAAIMNFFKNHKNSTVTARRA